MSNKSIAFVIMEAIVVGIILIIFVTFTQKYILQLIPNLSGHKDTIELFFIAGFLFHITFEYTGINLWYSKEYCKLL